MRRALRQTLAVGFLGTASAGFWAQSWALTIAGVWGLVWVATWEPSAS